MVLGFFISDLTVHDTICSFYQKIGKHQSFTGYEAQIHEFEEAQQSTKCSLSETGLLAQHLAMVQINSSMGYFIFDSVIGAA